MAFFKILKFEPPLVKSKDHDTTCVTSPVHSGKSNCSEMEIWYYYLFIYLFYFIGPNKFNVDLLIMNVL